MRFYFFFCLFTLHFLPDSTFGIVQKDLQADHLFQVLDRNDDEKLDPFEVLDRMLEIQSQLGNGPVTKGNMLALAQNSEEDRHQEAMELLKDLDKNKDGKTSIIELKDFLPVGMKLDKNGDGIISASEISKIEFEEDLLSPEQIEKEVRTIFRELDSNQDGFLSKNESDEELPWEQLTQIDRNQDSRVSKKEFLFFLRSENQPAGFKVLDHKAMMNGVIGSGTPAEVLRLHYQFPKVKTIIMVNVPGSMDDHANLRAAGMIRKFGYTTIVPKNGVIASGGTDFFLAGTNRFVEKGAKIGIHSWGGPGFQGKDLPKDHQQHRMYLDYYKQMDIPSSFYWRTLEAAPVQGVHWMTEEELHRFKFRTTFKPNKNQRKPVDLKNSELSLKAKTSHTVTTSSKNDLSKTKISQLPISRQESQAVKLSGEAKMMLALLDLNDNGQLEFAELEGDSKEMLFDLDKNQDKIISKEELKRISGNEKDLNKKLSSINTFKNDQRIVSVPKGIHPGLIKHFEKYTNVLAPNGKKIHFLAMSKWSNDRILRVRKVMEHFLRNSPDRRWGSKTSLANEMANNHATMVLLNDSDDMETVLPILENTNLQLQDLRANESPFEGEIDYMNHNTRDAAYEEVFHLIHGSGILYAMKPYDREIRKLAKQAAKRKIWNYDEPNMPGNHFEYIICIYDNFLDLWKTAPTLMEGRRIPSQPTGKSFGGEYHANQRGNISIVDPKGLELIKSFHPPKIGYTAELPAKFKGTFSIQENGKDRYSEKAKHLRNISLRGKGAGSLIGNDLDNRLAGNSGNNTFKGLGGDDSIFGGPGKDVAMFRGSKSQYTLKRVGSFVEVHDSMVNRDGYDVLSGIEVLRFSDIEVNVKQIR